MIWVFLKLFKSKEGGKRKIDGDLLLKICEKLNIELSHLHQTDINENTLSEILMINYLRI